MNPNSGLDEQKVEKPQELPNASTIRHVTDSFCTPVAVGVTWIDSMVRNIIL
jgi:hypothetical protein